MTLRSGKSGFEHVLIVGCGLIGGSFALALRRSGFTGKITAFGGKRNLILAVERGMVDEVEESFHRDLVCEADLIYLSAPISGIVDFLRTRSGQIRPDALVTDAGSTKFEICRVARELSIPHFIGGHPMAGSEQTGVEYARADLFDRATYALVIEQGTDQTQLFRLRSIVEAIGARVLLTSAEAHDKAVALISHLPQLTAVTLASLLAGDHGIEPADRELAQRLAASGWRDMTRLGGSSWNVWRDICLTNQINIIQVVDALISELQSLRDALERKDFNQVRELFESSNLSVQEQRAIHYSHFDKV